MRYVRIVIIAYCIAPSFSAFGQNSRFYRVSSTHASAIVEFESNGLLTWTNATSNAVSSVEWTTNLTTGAWTPAPVHAVVANLDGRTTMLVATVSTNAPTNLLQQSNLWANANATIEIAPLTYRLESVRLSRDFMSGASLTAWLDVVTATGRRIPDSLHISAICYSWNGKEWFPPVVPTTDGLPTPTPAMIRINSRYGPRWPIGALVEARVILSDNESQYLLVSEAIILRYD